MALLTVRVFLWALQSTATGIEGLDCSKSSLYKLCTTSPIKLYHKRVSRMESVFPIFSGYKLIDKPVQNLYGLVCNRGHIRFLTLLLQ